MGSIKIIITSKIISYRVSEVSIKVLYMVSKDSIGF